MPSKICPNCGENNPGAAYICSKCERSLADISPSFSPRNYVPLIIQSPVSTFDPVFVVKHTVPKKEVIALSITVLVSFIGYATSVALGGIQSVLSLSSLLLLLGTSLTTIVLRYWRDERFEFYESYFLKISRSKTEEVSYSEIQSVDEDNSKLKIRLKSQERRSRFHGSRAMTVAKNPTLPNGTHLDAFIRKKINAPALNSI